jgi:hypothetical protein
MKKYSISTIIILMIGFLTISATSGPIINFQVQIGRKSCNCCGFGICHFTISSVRWNQTSASKTSVNPQEAFGTATIEAGKLKLVIPKDAMTRETASKCMSGEFFTVEEDFDLSKDVCKELGISSYTIKKGKYRIDKSGSSYKMNL